MSIEDRDKGLAVRIEVMGEEFVQRAIDNTTEFTAPVQDWMYNC